MYLKAIEIRGFKSFMDKTVINLPRGMISIVGPNGSGKSNILDAIRWVLGEQSVKSLRSEKMQDVIFAGTQSKSQLGMCEVSLIIDNEDRQIDIEYTELAIKRKTYRNGESQFFINGKRCRLKDIRELLLDTGIGKEGYSIISQGKIDEIISSNGYQKRVLLEEASGIAKYRYKKEEGEKSLAIASENLERINDIYNEIENQIRPLKIQKEKAQKYLELKKELQSQEINKILIANEEYEHELAILTKDRENLTEDDAKTTQNLQEITENLAKLKEESEYIQKKKEELYAKKSSISEQISQNKMQISLKNENIKSLEKNNELIQEQLLQNKDEISKIRSKIENINESKKKISDNISYIQKEISEKQEIEQVYKDKIQVQSRQVQEKERKIKDVEVEISKLTMRMELVKNNISAFEEKIGQYDEKNQEYNAKISELEEEIGKKDSQILQKEEEISKLNEKLQINSNQRQKLVDENNKLIQEINHNSLNLKDITAKTEMLESFENDMQGFSKNVKLLLKNKDLEGIDNVVANIITVKKGYEKAIEQLLYGRLENVIIQKSINAKKAIDYLKKERLGRTTFLPLDVIKPSFLNYNDKGVKAIDVVSYDERYENIVSNLLGRYVIVEDMDTALEISAKYKHSFKISTISGDIFNIGGSITGGFSAYSKEIFTRRNTIVQNKQEISKLKEILQKLNDKFKDIEKNIDILKEESSKIQENLQHCNIEINEAIRQKDSAISKKEQITSLMSSLSQEKEEILSSNDKAISSYEKDKISRENLEQDYEKLSDEFKKQKESLEENEIALNENSKVLQERRIRHSVIEKELVAIENQLLELEGTLQSNDEKSENSNSKIKANNQQIQKFHELIKELESQSKTMQEEIETIQVKFEVIENGDVKNRQAIAKLNEDKEKISKLQAEVQTKMMRAETEESKVRYKMQMLYEQLSENYDMDMSMALSYKDDRVKVSQSVIKKLKEDIASLGNVNIDSIEEYKKIEERYLLYKIQKEDLEDSIAKISSIIKSLEKSMIHDFTENFDIINKNFDYIFKILFGGGSAKLTIEDESDILGSNIEISIQPPGKKLRGLAMLSGGEKALSAIALLFAIIAKKPVPFCILDEIDAPLDDANIYRYVTYLSTLSDTTQFVTITHRRTTMEASDYIYGVTMQEKGVSSVISLQLEDAKGYVED
jgi:chromosome segregation protein SMC